MKNEISLDTVCAALSYAMGVDAPENSGSHGLDMEEDLNIMHSYAVIPAEK